MASDKRLGDSRLYPPFSFPPKSRSLVYTQAIVCVCRAAHSRVGQGPKSTQRYILFGFKSKEVSHKNPDCQVLFGKVRQYNPS